MDKATTSAVLGTILGVLAGVAGMYFLAPKSDSGDREAELAARVAALEGRIDALLMENQELQDSLGKASKSDKLAAEIAADHDRLAREKGEATAEANRLKEELFQLKSSGAEGNRQALARISELEKLLESKGILEHLSPEEVQARVEKHKGAFELAFSTKDKKGVLNALWEMQNLGPAAYDTAIELWRMAARDFGLDPFGKGPGTLGLTFQEYVSLVNSFGMIQKGLTDPNVDADFRIASLYGLPWWSSQSAEDRAKLAGDILKTAKGYEAGVAVEALRDIRDPASERYLSEYLAGNTDNSAGRVAAINALALKNTPGAWASIEHAAQHDSDENVRKTAQARLATRNPGVEGVMITWVGADSQAALAGIKIGDILTHYNNVRIKTLEDVNKAKLEVAEGQTVTVVVRRGSEDVNLQLGPGMIGINGTAVAPTK